jgi:hypothetical protein
LILFLDAGANNNAGADAKPVSGTFACAIACAIACTNSRIHYSCHDRVATVVVVVVVVVAVVEFDIDNCNHHSSLFDAIFENRRRYTYVCDG